MMQIYININLIIHMPTTPEAKFEAFQQLSMLNAFEYCANLYSEEDPNYKVCIRNYAINFSQTYK
jgi:uncharacterized protein YpmS